MCQMFQNLIILSAVHYFCHSYLLDKEGHTGKVEKPENLSKAKCNLEKLGLHQQVKLDLGFCHPCAEMCGRYF